MTTGIYRAVEMIDNQPKGRILAEGTEAECLPFWSPGKVAITWHCNYEIKRYPPERLAKCRRTRLRTRLAKKHPLFADELFERELAARPQFYAGQR